MRAAGIALVMVVAAAAGSAVAPGCGHEARPAVQPAEPPPLPPASGSPIGYLFDDGRLQLSDDQLTRLKAIDADLAIELSYLDSVLRNTGSGDPPASQAPSRGGIGFSASGERSGQYGKLNVPDATSSVPGPVLPPDTATENAEIRQRVPEVRAYNVRTAVAHALAVLDAGQQKLARQILRDHGVDPDTGQFEGRAEPGRGSN